MHETLNKFNYLKHLKSGNKKFQYEDKTENYLRISKLSFVKIIKALSVVCFKGTICTTDRGLHFLRNWF